MSADRWSVCPQCRRRHLAKIDMLRSEISALYGTVSVEEFDARRDAAVKAAALDLEETFREDYEFSGAEEGKEIVASYSGVCEQCGLEVHFTHREPIVIDS